jgi:hypothetical protein
MSAYPMLMHTAIDATDGWGLAEFYRKFLSLCYCPGDEVPNDENDEGADWLVLLDGEGNRVLAVNQVPTLARPTWPSDEVPKQTHHDFRVSDVDELQRQRFCARACASWPRCRLTRRVRPG